jgi:hypothetical protein
MTVSGGKSFDVRGGLDVPNECVREHVKCPFHGNDEIITSEEGKIN